MKIPKGFIKDSEGIYRRGNFVFKDNKIFRESFAIENLKDNKPTMQDCIREALSFYSILGDKPRTSNTYIDKAGEGFKITDKFSKNTVAVITPDRNVFEINTTAIGDSTDFKDLVNKDKKDLPVNAKALKKFSSDKPKEFDKLKESDEGFIKKLYATKNPYEVLQLIITALPDGDLKDEAISSWVYYKDRNRDMSTYHDLIADLLDTMEENPNWRQDRLKKTIPKEELDESAEGVQEFWDKFDKGEIKIGDTFANDVKLIDANKKADYVLVFRKDEYVAAWAPELSGKDLVWGQGHYFDNEEDAKEYFNSKLNESEKLKESTKFYCTEEPDAYLELQNLKTLKNSAGKVLDVNTHGLIQNGDTVYVVTSDSDLDTVKVYSVDYQFPYVFKAGKKEEGGNE